MNWRRLVEVLGLILALAALLVGVVHLWEIRKTAHDLQIIRSSFSKDLHNVQASLSTQYAGAFPDFLDDVIGTIRSAQREIVISCDFPAYADFSDPRRSLILRQAIEQKVQAGVKVHLICLDQNRRLTALHQQFNQPSFEKSLSVPQQRNAILRYLGSSRSRNTPVTYDEFISAVEGNDDMTMRQTFRNAEVLQVNMEMPLFFWIADRSRGVMAVQTFGGEEEYGFRTQDLALVNALLATGDRYKHGS
jgi:hypothetical protein